MPTIKSIKNHFGITWAIVPIGGNDSKALLATISRELDDLVLSPALQEAGLAGKVQRLLTIIAEQTSDDINMKFSDAGASELITEAKDQMSAMVATMVETMAREPRQQLAAAVDNFLVALSNPDRIIRASTFNGVQQAFERLRGFGFIADRELLDRMRTLDTEMQNVSAQDLNADRSTGARLAEALKLVRNQASDPSVINNSVRKFRAIATA